MDSASIALLHRTIVTTFLLFFLFKTILLILKKNELLNSIRSKTKIVDIVLGILIIVSGVYLMMVTKNVTTWITSKALLVLIAIPLGIIAMKKSNLILAILVNLILIAAYGIGEAKPWRNRKEPITQNTEKNKQEDSLSINISDTISQSIIEQNTVAVSTNAKAVYIEKCTFCHGEDGRKGTLNAADLSISTLGTQDKIKIITNGKGAMAGFEGDLSTEEIESLALYLTMLRK